MDYHIFIYRRICITWFDKICGVAVKNEFYWKNAAMKILAAKLHWLYWDNKKNLDEYFR